MGLIRFAGDRYAALSSDTFPDVMDGAKLTTVDTFAEYVRQNGAWIMLSGSQLVSGFSSVVRERLHLTGAHPSGSVIGIPNGRTFDAATNRLSVMLNGIQQSSGLDNDYMEQSNSGTSFHFPLPTGSVITWDILKKDSSVTT